SSEPSLPRPVRPVAPYPVVVISQRVMATAVAAAAIMLAAGCTRAGPHPQAAAPARHTPSGQPASGGPSHPATPRSGHRRTRVSLPLFSATVSGPLSPRDVPFSWHPGCPVSPDSLRAIRLSFVGFDGMAHSGEIIVNASVANQVIKVFSL